VRLTGECIDSIIIKYNDDVKKRYCGELLPDEIKSIEDHKGKVKITVSIDRSVPFSDPEDYVEFKIVATAFKGNTLHSLMPTLMLILVLISDCQDLDKEFMCKKNMRRSCISNSFVNDSIINCLEPYCSDESLGCIRYPSLSSIGEDPNVTNNLPQIFLSAITSLLLTMMCCGCVLYSFIKIKRCWSPQPTSQSTTTRVHRRRRRNNTADSGAPTNSDDNSPTAPPIDKDDLPPPYDALFPDRAKQDAPNT
jgi:hypothetical protein